MKGKCGMVRIFCTVFLAILLASCASTSPAVSSEQPAATPHTAPYVREDGAIVLKELPTPDSDLKAVTDRGFFVSEFSARADSQLLTFYDFETRSQRVVCNVSGCSHIEESCPARVSGSPWRIGDWLYSFGSVNPDDSSMVTRVERRDLNGENPEELGVIGGEWMFSAGCYTDGTSLYTYDGSDFVCIELPSCHVTMVERYRSDKPQNGASLLTMTRPDGQVYYLGWDPAAEGYPGRKLAQDGETVYSVDPLNGWIYTYDIPTGQSRVLSRETNQYIWTWETPIGWDDQGHENRWKTNSSAQSWTGKLIDGALLIDLDGGSVEEQDADVRVAINLADGSMTLCPLSDFWMDRSHPINVRGQTDYGLWVIPYTESTPGAVMDQSGAFHMASTNVKTVYALISTEDFLAGVPNYQIFESLPRDEGGIL